jgi:hypothetical protein
MFYSALQLTSTSQEFSAGYPLKEGREQRKLSGKEE